MLGGERPVLRDFQVTSAGDGANCAQGRSWTALFATRFGSSDAPTSGQGKLASDHKRLAGRYLMTRLYLVPTTKQIQG